MFTNKYAIGTLFFIDDIIQIMELNIKAEMTSYFADAVMSVQP